MFLHFLQVISHALSHLPLLISSVDDMSSPRCRKDELMAVAKQANAALAALGGFEPTIKPGCTVQITGDCTVVLTHHSFDKLIECRGKVFKLSSYLHMETIGLSTATICSSFVVQDLVFTTHQVMLSASRNRRVLLPWSLNHRLVKNFSP